ncbi:MAG: 4'-phosphopantetheinyl transferase family protein [Cognaticolwellia sp.]
MTLWKTALLNTIAIKIADINEVAHADNPCCILSKANDIDEQNLSRLSSTLLHEQEQKVFLQRKNITAKKEYLTSRFLIKTVLSQRLNLPYEKMQLRFNSKTSTLEALVNNKALAINISLAHSKGSVFFAINDEKSAIGVDIEYQNSKRNIIDVAKTFFHPDECKVLTKDSIQQFYQLWTLKESLAKATGQSIFQLLGQNTKQLLKHYQYTLGQFEQFQLAVIHTNQCSTIPCYVVSLNNLMPLCHE